MKSKRQTHKDIAAAVGQRRLDVPVAFSRALQARVDYAMAICTTDEGSDARNELLKRARYGARDLGRDLVLVGAHDLQCPQLFVDVPMLQVAFESEVLLTEVDQARDAAELADALTSVDAEMAQERAADARRTKVKAAIAAGDWAALDLPTPEVFVKLLAAGESAEADGHTFDYIKGEGLWCTNPYGVDAYFGESIPSINYARELLTAIASGTIFGDTPPGSD
ncbi:hypothetical protein [Burkholderia gladioli]|uniref:hypothetical protein n=1 Tax=Burkholderia gladioli TaxID=28095 RepID=UPI00163F4D5F|nr:hypothetical protein [Burkholderia gladioli]